MKLAHIADRVARDIYTRWPVTHSIPQSAQIRDACDTATGGDLPPRTLDRLCDMVHARLHDERYWIWRHEARSLHEFRKGIKK